VATDDYSTREPSPLDVFLSQPAEPAAEDTSDEGIDDPITLAQPPGAELGTIRHFTRWFNQFMFEKKPSQ
jgi:hypothetical protein